MPGGTRPLSDRAREGLFSTLGEAVAGAAVLDLFAGTGAIGIEALSRGAGRAVFVDSSPDAVRAIRENLERTKLTERAGVVRQDVARALRSDLGQFDLVLLDPPYALEGPALDAVLADLASSASSSPAAWSSSPGKSRVTRLSFRYTGAPTGGFRTEGPPSSSTGLERTPPGGARDGACGPVSGDVRSGHQRPSRHHPRAAGVFDHVVVAVLENPGKEPLFSLEERPRCSRRPWRTWTASR